MTEDMPIKLERISNWLWPRKFYVKIKETHPILGSIFLGIWSIFWTALAIALNIVFFLVIFITIALVLTAIFGDSGSDPIMLDMSWFSNKRKNEDK